MPWGLHPKVFLQCGIWSSWGVEFDLFVLVHTVFHMVYLRLFQLLESWRDALLRENGQANQRSVWSLWRSKRLMLKVRDLGLLDSMPLGVKPHGFFPVWGAINITFYEMP